MRAINLSDFENVLKSNVIELSALNKADPIKTREEIRADWLKQRIGKFTASNFHRLMGYPNKDELPSGAVTYVMEKIAESLVELDTKEGYISQDMQLGIDNEAGAVQAFMEKTGLQVDKHGFEQKLFMYGLHAGCTPDGIIGKTSGVEIKCPKSATHISYWAIKTGDDLKRECPNYYWQVQGQMMITARDEWYFVSFDPRFKNKAQQLHIAKIHRNSTDIALLKNRLDKAIQLKKDFIKSLQSKDKINGNS